MYVKDVKGGKKTHTHIFAHNFLNIQLIFQSGKSFGKLRIRKIMCILKHVKEVKNRSSTLKERL